MELNNNNFSRDYVVNQVIGQAWTPVNSNVVAGEFSFKANSSKHSILLCSRFNANSQEENGPFPGWFLQMAGTGFSLAFGNGKTWTSVKSLTAISLNKWHHVSFSMNNDEKHMELIVDGNSVTMENVAFRKPCNYLNIGGLNNRKEFQFDGEIKDIKLGDFFLPIVEIQDAISDENSLTHSIQKSKENIELIKSSVQNFENDIASLEEIEKQIESWILRGLEIDTTKLKNQKEKFMMDLEFFNTNMKSYLDSLKEIDNMILSEMENGDHSQSVVDQYGTYLHNLMNDLEEIEKAYTQNREFEQKGIEIGNALETMNTQKNEISEKIKETEHDLSNRLLQITDMMKIVTLFEI